MDKRFALFVILGVIIFSSIVVRMSAQENEIVGTNQATVCCETTRSGLTCQDVLAEHCAPDSRQPPTACESTSFCQTGWCYDSKEGYCLDNTPQFTCNKEGGTWSLEEPAVCGLGCCVLDDQAAFVTQVNCKRLSGFAGIEANWNPTITNAPQCVLTAGNKEKGACVYWDKFERGCKFTTRENCVEGFVYGTTTSEATQSANAQLATQLTPAPQPTIGQNSSNGSSVTGSAILASVSAQENTNFSNYGIIDFHPGKLCSAEELGTICSPTENTVCMPGKEEVYFVDTCGNPANIYDASKIRDKNYWNEIVEKANSCGFGGSNEDSKTCGNCNYLLGSFCRSADKNNPTYGDNICQSLNCVDGNGQKKIHGESWCIYDGGTTGAPGSRAYRQLCNNGEIIVEPCADFRQEECIESSATGFSQAACRVNRWQDCTAQTEQFQCENGDVRDCKWMPGFEYVLFGSVLNGTTIDANSLGAIAQGLKEIGGLKNVPEGSCVPKTPPGLNRATDEAPAICAQANAVCPVKYEKSLLSGEWECVEHCDCLPGGALEKARVELCMSIGDCGPKVNYVGVAGSGPGYSVDERKLDS